MDAMEDEWNMNSIFTYMKDHIIQILMLLAVFVIIYLVDRISNINTALFSMPSAILQNKQVTAVIKSAKGKRQTKK